MNRTRIAMHVMAALQAAQLAEGGQPVTGTIEPTQTVDANPLGKDIQAQVEQNLVEEKEVSFSFRTDKDTLEKRETFKPKIPLLTQIGVAAAITAQDKTTQLIVDAANEVIIDRARGMINEAIEANPKVKLGEDWTLDISKLTLVAIANLPKAERGSGIPKDAWTAFVADYKAAMQKDEAIALFPDKKKRAAEVLDKHGVLLAGKFNQVRSRKDVVEQMLGFLDVWAQVSTNVEEHAAAYDYLREKGQTLLKGETFEDL